MVSDYIRGFTDCIQLVKDILARAETIEQILDQVDYIAARIHEDTIEKLKEELLLLQ